MPLMEGMADVKRSEHEKGLLLGVFSEIVPLAPGVIKCFGGRAMAVLRRMIDEPEVDVLCNAFCFLCKLCQYAPSAVLAEGQARAQQYMAAMVAFIDEPEASHRRQHARDNAAAALGGMLALVRTHQGVAPDSEWPACMGTFVRALPLRVDLDEAAGAISALSRILACEPPLDSIGQDCMPHILRAVALSAGLSKDECGLGEEGQAELLRVFARVSSVYPHAVGLCLQGHSDVLTTEHVAVLQTLHADS
jgi:hypothetical protein